MACCPPMVSTPFLPQRQNRQKESWSWCRSRFLAGFRNHGSRQQRHLADTYKASSDQAFHQRSEQEWAFCSTPSNAAAKLIGEKPTGSPTAAPQYPVQLKLSGKSGVAAAAAALPIHHFLPMISSAPPARYLSKWKLDSKYRQILQQLDNWQSWKGRQT